MELDILKNAGENTPHKFFQHLVNPELPPRRGKNASFSLQKQIIQNVWYDQCGINYSYLQENNILRICAMEFFPETIVDYINSIPSSLKTNIVLEIRCGSMETAGFNMLCDLLSRLKTSRSIIIDMSNMKFGYGTTLDIEKLPHNVKISNVINAKGKEDDFYSENSVDWWGLNLNDADFEIYMSKMTLAAAKRALELRKIAHFVYEHLKVFGIDNLSITEKTQLVYDWCQGKFDNSVGKIFYDTESTLADGSLNINCRYSQDPIETFKRKKGVCAGRARLLKVILNNYYMKVPCFLVKGMAGRLQHEWNEIIDENGHSIFFDLSEQSNLHRINHEDYNLSRRFLPFNDRKM